MVSRATLAVRSPAPLRPVDRLVLGYTAFSTVVALARLPGYPAVGGVLVANVLIVLLVALARRADPGPAGRLARTLYPLLTLGAFYPAIDLLNHFGAVVVHDATVQRWELALFGSAVSRTWWMTHPSPFWSSLLHGVYFAYYPIVLGPPLLFLAMGRSDAAERSVLWLMATFLACYAVFLLYPVAGPYYEYPRPSPVFLDNGPARLVYRTLERGSAHYGAASLLPTWRPRWWRRPRRGGVGDRSVRSSCRSPCCSRWAWSTARCTTRWMRWRVPPWPWS